MYTPRTNEQMYREMLSALLNSLSKHGSNEIDPAMRRRISGHLWSAFDYAVWRMLDAHREEM